MSKRAYHFINGKDASKLALVLFDLRGKPASRRVKDPGAFGFSDEFARKVATELVTGARSAAKPKSHSRDHQVRAAAAALKPLSIAKR